jgi:hypothetical protein
MITATEKLDAMWSFIRQSFRGTRQTIVKTYYVPAGHEKTMRLLLEYYFFPGVRWLIGGRLVSTELQSERGTSPN